jgi:hypothetical protein
MGSRQLGELLLRPSPLRSLTIRRPEHYLCLSQRSLSTSASRFAGQSPPKPDGQRIENPKDPNQTIGDALPSTQTSQTNSADATSSIIDALWANSGIAQTQDPSSRRPFGANFSMPGSAMRPKRTDWDTMDLPSPLTDAPAPPIPAVSDKDIVYPRLNASTGRTVELDNARGRDIVRGITMLSSLMARNKVKYDFNKQKFHERPGLRRKRLKSERWRARFKTEFDATCKRVTELTRKGW